MVRKECKMANLGKIRDGVKMIGGVVEMTGVAKSLVNAGQWGEALGVIEDLEKLWDASKPVPLENEARGQPQLSLNGNGDAGGHKPGLSPLPPTLEEGLGGQDEITTPHEAQKTVPIHYPVSLSSLHAFSALPSHLRALVMEIASSLSLEFVAVLRSDLETRINNDYKVNAEADQGLKDRLKPLLLNLVRTKGLKEGVLSWREVVLIEVCGVVKKVQVYSFCHSSRARLIPDSDFIRL
jgi:vacuolar protein sorting-associated protein 54